MSFNLKQRLIFHRLSRLSQPVVVDEHLTCIAKYSHIAFSPQTNSKPVNIS